MTGGEVLFLFFSVPFSTHVILVKSQVIARFTIFVVGNTLVFHKVANIPQSWKRPPEWGWGLAKFGHAQRHVSSPNAQELSFKERTVVPVVYAALSEAEQQLIDRAAWTEKRHTYTTHTLALSFEAAQLVHLCFFQCKIAGFVGWHWIFKLTLDYPSLGGSHLGIEYGSKWSFSHRVRSQACNSVLSVVCLALYLLCLCLSLCLALCLSVCLSCLPACLSLGLWFSLFLSLSLCPFVFFRLSVCVSFNVSHVSL